MAPAEAEQIVAERLGQKTLFAEIKHAGRTVAFGKLGAVGAVDERDMGEFRQRPSHGVENLDLPKSVGEVVVAADDMGDLHVVVVHHHGVEVGGRAVRAEDDHVVELGVGDADGALHKVFHDRLAIARGAQADRGSHTWRRLGGVEVAPAAIIAGRAAFGLRALAHVAKVLGAGIAFVGGAGGEHGVRDLDMAGFAGGLEDRRRIRVQAEPGQAVEDDVHRRFGAAGFVGILDAEQEFAAFVAGGEKIEQSGAGAADMQQAGGGGGEAGADGHWRAVAGTGPKARSS